jgi:hypothetical protein
MKQKVIAIWYDDEWKSSDSMFTWLSIQLEDWRIIKHYSMEIIKPFDYEKK